MTEKIPIEIKHFIDQNFESLAQLEAVLLIRQDSERLWDSSELAKSLYLPVELAAAILAALASRGFLRVEPSPDLHYRYHASHTDLDRQLSQLASTYLQRRVAVITMIYSKPLNKVQTFADAFRLRKENPQ